MILIFNSTPLIYLGKTKVLELIKRLETKNLIPEKVYREVVEAGKEEGKADAFYIEKLVKENVFTIKRPKNRKLLNKLLKIRGLHQADAKTLTLAKEMKGIAIVDDEVARDVADLFDIEHKGTIFILFRLMNKQILIKEEVKEIIDHIIKLGWFCSTDVYSEIMKRVT